MVSNAERCAEHEKFKKIDAAFRAGDLAALRSAVDDPASVPNGPLPVTIGSCLEYAIYHSPLPFIRTLLETGADPNPAGHAGFPPLIAALSCRWPRPGSPGGASSLVCVPVSLARNGPALGAQAGERRLREIMVDQGGFSSMRRATETPFNIVLEAEP
jgi:hypothetical protein